MAQDPYRYFRLEARELLEQFSAGVAELEKSGASPALVQRLLRLAHTLKGAARVVRQPQIAERAHAIEEAISPFRDGMGESPPTLAATLLAHLDDIDARVGALAVVAQAPAAAPEAAPAPIDEGLRTVRADVAEMDGLLEGIAETHTILGGLRAADAQLAQARHLADLLAGQLAPRASAQTGRAQPTDLKRAHDTTEELRRRLDRLERVIGGAGEQMDRELRQLREAAEQLRLVSAGALFASLERAAREVAPSLGKRVAFTGHGGDIRLDAYVLTTIQRALVQIIRNAVAHGIEPEAQRRAAGKPPVGQLRIDIRRRGRSIIFDCRDDGRGIDLEAVRGAAMRRGLPAAKAANLGAEALVEMLLHGGISTSEAVTNISGRGIGLDVVRAAVEQLGGTVSVRTEDGKGTRFELAVPLSLAALDVLVVEASGNAVTIPLDAVETALRLPAEAISWHADGASVLHEQTAIPFVSLSRLLFGGRHEGGRNWSAVVVSGASGMVALGIDRLLGTARAVMRPLPDHTPASAMVAGASLNAQGNPQLVLDPDGLAAEVRGVGAAALEPSPARLPVLIIDDSLTTRMLEQSILESAGYDVDVAISGEDGLEHARARRYALFLVDVEMPGIDGFTFVERIRADPQLRDIPAILVTSRNAPEDRQRGRDVGAQGYIVKSEFDQTELLRMIPNLMG